MHLGFKFRIPLFAVVLYLERLDFSGIEDIKVVATGGMGKSIFENTSKIDYYDANLTMQGLRIIYEKNKRG